MTLLKSKVVNVTGEHGIGKMTVAKKVKLYALSLNNGVETVDEISQALWQLHDTEQAIGGVWYCDLKGVATAEGVALKCDSAFLT